MRITAKIEPSLRDCLSGYEDEDRTKVSEACEVRMRFVISNKFLDMGSIPISSTIWGNGVIGSRVSLRN